MLRRWWRRRQGKRRRPSSVTRLGPATPYRLLRNQLGSVRAVYLAGDSVRRRDDMAVPESTVMLLHGFFQTRNIWEVMEDRLRFDGHAVMSFNLGGLLSRFNTHRVDYLAREVAEKVEGLAARRGLDRFHIVGHSKGGLVARRYVQHYGGDKRALSVTTLGTPHHGTPVAALGVALMGFGALSRSPSDLMPGSQLITRLSRDSFPAQIPLTSIYSRTDVICPYWCATLRPRPGEGHLRNVEIGGLGHSELTWDARVYREVRQCIETADTIWAERKAGTEAAR